MAFNTSITTFAALGTGVIGSGWIARALANGLDVVAWDPAPNAETTLRTRIQKCWPALEKNGLKPGASQQRLRFVATVEECASQADFIQESAPETLSLKIDLHTRIAAAAREDVLIGSSTSGLLPSEFYAKAKNPQRCLVGHPFNPVYLLPLVEVVGGSLTSPLAIEAAIGIYKNLGMKPLHVRKEVPGFIADRLLEAQWREALHLVNDGVATTGEIDDAIRYGAGIRWSFMGSFLIYTLAGGDAGMRHFMSQFGPALKLPWTKLVAPELTEDLIDAVVDGTNVQLGQHSIASLERYRDDCLMAVQEAVRVTKLKHGISLDE
jgi:carnitine 3-dehydrogenase